MSLLRSLKERILFFKTGITDHSQVVSFFPSSRQLTKTMLEDIDYKKANVILEYGPGTGTFTREMLKKAGPGLRLFVFELNPAFFKFLKEEFTDPRVTILNQGAETSKAYLKSLGIEKVDYIISSLPFSHIPEEIRKTVLSDAVQLLQPYGSLNHYRYNRFFVPELKTYFPQVEMKTVILNLPPAYVYMCRNSES